MVIEAEEILGAVPDGDVDVVVASEVGLVVVSRGCLGAGGGDCVGRDGGHDGGGLD